MILKNFVVTDRINSNFEFSGMDCYAQCFDKKHFENFPNTVHYNYNSRGFRDREWPESLDDLQNNVIWCIGDSFTTGIGSALEHTWPRIIEQQSGMKTINVSRDGASNEWISHRAQELISEITPKFVIIMWSFIHRRQQTTLPGQDFDPAKIKQLHSARTTGQEDIAHFSECLRQVSDLTGSTVCHTMVPEPAPVQLMEQCQDLIAQQQYHIPVVQKIDLARDGFHFDRVTAECVATQALLQIQL